MSEETTTPVKFDQWALVEIMGHRKLAGRVTEETVAGHAMLRVDVPACNGTPEWTTFLGPSSIFSLTPVSELVARAKAAELQARPVTIYRTDIQSRLTLDDEVEFDDEE